MPRAWPVDLDAIRVGDCMHHGIVSCDAAASLAEAAAAMCAHRVHALAIIGDGRRAGIVSDAALVAAAERAADCTAGELAGSESPTVSTDGSLREAARLMTEHGVTHLLVRDAHSGHLSGVISTTDVVCAIVATTQT